jgi:hypothetical protein
VTTDPLFAISSDRRAGCDRRGAVARIAKFLNITSLRGVQRGGNSIQIFKQQIHVHILAAGDARGLRFVSLKLEGAGNAGCALHPRSRVQNRQRKRTRAYRFSGGTPAFPAQWLYDLLRAPRRIGLCCLRRLRIAGSSAPGRADLPSADLTPTTEASGPHDFTVRFSIVRPARRCPLTETALRTNFTPDTAASTASHPNVW